jgi:hypothetical protein
MSKIIQKFKKEKDIIGKDVIKKLVAECLSQRGEDSLMSCLKNYQDEENSNYVNALHTWSSSKDGREYWDDLNNKVGY